MSYVVVSWLVGVDEGSHGPGTISWLEKNG